MTVTPRIIWRAATARTGGTLLTELSCDLMTRGGRSVRCITNDDINEGFSFQTMVPKPHPHFLERIRGETLYGAHDNLFTAAFRNPMFRVLFVRRDIREAAASLRRMAGTTIDALVELMENWHWVHRKMASVPAENLLILDYAEVLDVDLAVRKIAAFLNEPVSDTEISAYCKRFGKGSVADRLNSARESIIAELVALAPECRKVGGIRVNLSTGDRSRAIEIPLTTMSLATHDLVKRDEPTPQIELTLPECGDVVLIGNQDGSAYRILEAPKLLPWHFQFDHVTAATTPPWQSAFEPHEIRRIEEVAAPIRDDLGY